MSRLTLKLRATPSERIDLTPLLPAARTAATTYELAQLVLQHGRKPVRLGDVFDVAGTLGGDITIETGTTPVDGLGAGMSSGVLVVEGTTGSQAGRGMTGGRLEIKGNAGDHLAAAMKGGLIHVAGSAGSNVGSVTPGRRFGMTGGTVVVEGDIGARAGDKMRRGLILVRGRTGEAAGSRMVGGTMIAEQGFGPSAGLLMRRGTLIGPSVAHWLPTFADCGPQDLVILRLMARSYARELGPLAPRSLPSQVRRYAGDLATIGKGEILITSS